MRTAARNEATARRRRLGLAPLLVLPVGFGLWVLRTEAHVVEQFNDGTLHAAMIRAAGRAFASGHIPLDAWFPFLSTGSANFHQYQSLPHIVVGLFASFLGGDRAFAWSLFVLLATWPISVYLGSRLLGWQERSAVAAAFVAPLVASWPGYGYEWGSYLFPGLGVWSQLWGMWLLPIALGLTWRAVERRSNLAPAAIALSLAIVGHLLTGYFAVLAVGVWCLVRLEGGGFVRRAGRGAAVVVAATCAGAWLIVPLLMDRKWVAGGSFLRGFWHDSYGTRTVLRWLVTGRLFDSGFGGAPRYALITILVFVGLAVCVTRFRTDVRARALAGLFVLSLVLYSGPATYGFLLDRLPGSSVLLFHRYILAVHVTGILLAGVGAAQIVGYLQLAAKRFAPSLDSRLGAGALVLAAVLVLAPAWKDRADYAGLSGNLIVMQEHAEAADAGNRAALIDLAKRRGAGRIYAGKPTNWGLKYDVGFIPTYSAVLNRDAEGIGFTFRMGTMVTDAEAYLDESNPAQLDVFGVRYLLLPRGRPTPVPAHLIETRGKHALWDVPGSGYVALVDTVEPIRIPTQVGAGVIQNSFLRSNELRRGLYPTVAYLGGRAEPPTASAASPPSGPAGSVEPVEYRATAGLFRARVTANRTAVVLLKASYHGRWRVTVDGKIARKYMVAPGYPGVTVQPGTHDVEFRYIPVGSYPWLFLFGLASLVALHLGLSDRARRRLRARASGRPDVVAGRVAASTLGAE